MKKENKTIIFVTNNINEIFLSDRILILENKGIKNIIKKEELLENIKILEDCEIKIPDVVQIILKLKENGQVINLEKWTIEEMINEIVKVCNQ